MAHLRSNRFNIEFFGNPAASNRMKTIATDPFYLFSSDHPLALMLPEALNTTEYGSKIGIAIRDMNFIVLAGVALDSEVANGGTHFIIDPARLTKLFSDLDAQGAQLDTIQGDATFAMPRAHSILSHFIAKLPIDDRIIEADDVFYDGTADNAGTGTCFDWITPKLFITGEGHERHVLLSQFMLMLPDYHFKGTPTTGGRSSSTFTDILDQMLSVIAAAGQHRAFEELPFQAQATALVAWWKRTRPPVMLIPYVSNPCMEVERRAVETRAGQLGPLLAENWRPAFPLIGNFWPHPVDDIIAEMSALATSLNIPGITAGLTIEVIMALSAVIKDLGVFAVGSTNAERTAEIVRAFKHSLNDKDKDISAESKQALQSDPVYIDLRNEVIKYDLSEPLEIAKLLLRHPHVFGILFMNGKCADGDFWKRMGAIRTESTVQGIFTEMISFNTKGEPAEYGAILAEGIGKSLLKGVFNRNWWTTLAPLIAKREGIATHGKIDKRLRGLSAAALYADADAMRILEHPIRMIMKLLGLNVGNEIGSFVKTWRTLIRMASAIEGLPDYCQPKKGLRTRLIEIGEMIFKCPQDRFECMLATPPTAATKVTEFLIEGPAHNALLELDGYIDRIIKDVDDASYGFSRNASLNKHGDHDDDDDDSDGEIPINPKKKRKFERTVVDDTAYTKGDAKAWGLAASTHGIFLNAEGTILAFGSQVATKFETPPNIEANCVACFAPSKHCAERNKWCKTPGPCWKAGGADAHARVKDFPDEVCRPMPNEKHADIDWDKMVEIDKDREPPANGWQRGGRGRGKGAGGRGPPNNRGKGSGKGGKGGRKGGGKGGGKGGDKGGGRGGGKGGRW